MDNCQYGIATGHCLSYGKSVEYKAPEAEKFIQNTSDFSVGNAGVCFYFIMENRYV